MIRPFNRKPVRILHPPKMKKAYITLAEAAIKELVAVAHVVLPIQVSKDARITNLLKIGKDLGRDGQLNAGAMLDAIQEDIIKEECTDPRYELLITDKDIFAGDTTYVFGTSQPYIGCVFSFNRFKDDEVAKTVLMHELGHTFSLPARKEDIVDDETSLGAHCIHKCIMRQGLSLPAMTKIAQDRLAGYLLCKLCQDDLMRFFWAQSPAARNPVCRDCGYFIDDA